MSSVYFQMVCIFFSLLLIFVYFPKKKVNNVENKLFGYLVIINFFGLFLDIFSSFVIRYFDINYFPLILGKLILLLLFFWMLYFTLYIVHISYEEDKKKSKHNKILYFIAFVSVALIFILPIQILDLNGHFYSSGQSVYFVYIISFVFGVILVYAMLSNIKKIFSKKYYPLFAYLLFGLIFVVVQFVFPWLVIMVPVETFVTYLMYFTIENPDVKLLEEVHKSKEISDAANEEKTLFLYNMTQEIRNTNDEINANADIILDSDSLDEDKNCAREIKGITSRFNSMTNEMFDVSKLDAASVKLYTSKYNIKNIFKEIVAIYNKKCMDANLDFRVNIDHDVPEIMYGDSIGLKEVLNIILDNSIKYTKSGFVEFSVNTILKNDVCRLIITIEDSGIGIKSSDINDIKVSGKSLSKANKLITLMDGALMISSNYGYGTKIKIILDQKVEHKVNETVAKYEEMYDDINLLVVDDSESGIKIIDKLIKGSNIKMDFAMNGKDCIDKIKSRNKYDVILLDEQLAQISAMDLIRKIADVNEFNIPIILLTKDNSYEYNDEYKNLGFDGYLLKPVKKNELLNKINECKNKDN